MYSFDEIVKQINDDKDTVMLSGILIIHTLVALVTLYLNAFIPWFIITVLTVTGVVLVLRRKDKIISPTLKKKEREKLHRYMQDRLYFCSITKHGDYEIAVFSDDGVCLTQKSGCISELAEKAKENKKAETTLKIIKYMYDSGASMSRDEYEQLV